MRPRAQKPGPRSAKLSPRHLRRLFFSTFGHFFSDFLSLFNFLDEFFSPRSAQECSKSSPRPPRRAPEHAKRPPKPLLGDLSEAFWQLREGFEKHYSKNIRIELSCRRELDSEGFRDNENQSKFTFPSTFEAVGS